MNTMQLAPMVPVAPVSSRRDDCLLGMFVQLQPPRVIARVRVSKWPLKSLKAPPNWTKPSSAV